MARTKEPTIAATTGNETLYARINENNDLEIKIGPRGKYHFHYHYKNAYMALCRARKLVAKLGCSDLKIMNYPEEHIPERTW